MPPAAKGAALGTRPLFEKSGAKTLNILYQALVLCNFTFLLIYSIVANYSKRHKFLPKNFFSVECGELRVELVVKTILQHELAKSENQLRVLALSYK